jgi:ParB family chromosome partitioning protein
VSAKVQRGLGRGLDALLPRAEGSTKQVAVSDLKVSALQPRKVFAPDALAELAASIAEKGVLQPLLVRTTKGGFEIVAGERRFRAAQMAGLKAVPVVVRELDDRQALEVAIIENLQREDLDDLEEAEAYQQLLGFGLSQEDVAKAVGKSRPAIANALRLLTLSKEAKQALRDGTITAGHARAILAQAAADRAWALEQIAARQLTVRQAEALRRQPEKPTAKKGAGGERQRRYLAISEELTRQLGARVLVKGGKRGSIELRFHDEEELERLLEALGYRG